MRQHSQHALLRAPCPTCTLPSRARSVRYAVVTVVPIGLVVAWLYAIMELAGFALNFVSATIGAISIGVVYWGLERMVRSPWGRVLRAIREDETAALALGKNVFRYRLQAFVVGCAVMGLSGALYANFQGFISPQDFIPIFTFQVFIMLIVGGSGNNLGAILGGVVVWALWSGSGALIAGILPPTIQTQAASVRIVLIGLGLVLMLLYRPAGILREKRIVSQEARLPDGVAGGRAASPGD